MNPFMYGFLDEMQKQAGLGRKLAIGAGAAGSLYTLAHAIGVPVGYLMGRFGKVKKKDRERAFKSPRVGSLLKRLLVPGAEAHLQAKRKSTMHQLLKESIKKPRKKK